jgi:Bacterial cadherin-like domain/Bacterial Ig domain/Bacterial pre-peptidase C-terminal domain/Dockerin type I domain/GEVED domain
MTIRRLRNTSSPINTNTPKNAKASSDKKRGTLRRYLLETLESRQLLAAGPQLIGVQPNNSDLIENGVVRNIAPRELTFRFDDSQVIDASTVGGIRVTRAGLDGSFALPSVTSDFGSNGRADILLTSRNAADLLVVNVVRSDLGPTGDPTFAISGANVTITLNSNPNGLVTAQKLVDSINASAVASPRLTAKLNGGLASAKLGGVDSSTYSPIRLTSNNDVIVQPGAVVIGDSPNENEVTLRFAENLPDDTYRLEVFGFDDAGRGIKGLRNTNGDFFVPSKANTRQDTIDFRLDLGSKVTAVVPQPVVRLANGSIEQQRNTIVVYFDNDKLLVENGADGKPTSRSVENPAFYQLIYTADTVRNTDDLPAFLPSTVTYNASANTATLRFDGDIDSLPGPFLPSSTFRLRIGTNETAPMSPVRSEASATAISDLNTGGKAKLRFTSKVLGESGSGITVSFVSGAASPNPTVSVNGNAITVNIGSATATAPNTVTTVNQVLVALETDPISSALIKTTLEPGSDGSQVIGNRAINYSPVTLYGLGSTFDTATNLGTIGSSNVPQTSLLLSSAIDPEVNSLDLVGAADDPAQREVAETFENHINPAFGGDNFPGIRTIYYNFQNIYGTDAGVPVSNAITEKQKARVREAFALWSNKLGVQFVESASSGLTMALGTTNALAQGQLRVESVGQWGVRIDPTYQNSLAVFSANNVWNDNYGENFTRAAATSIGFMLGLSRAGDLDPSELLNLDSGFLDFQTTTDRNFEPIFPGNQDIIHGQYLHRPESSDIDMYRFDIDFGANGQSREGVLVAETLAERSADSSPLDTRLALYKEVLATATSNLGLGQGVNLQFTAVKSGKLGNNLQVFVTRSNRGAGALPIVNVFPNAITVDLNSTTGSETTLGELVAALDNDPAARSLVKVNLLSGNVSTKVGNHDITYSPITLKGGDMQLISQNDNYFSKDSLIRQNLSSGVYFVGVSASGNDQYDATIPNTGTGGKTQGKYDLRLTFRAQTDSNDSIQDIAGPNGDASQALDGDADGTSGGVNNFWFQTRPLDRALRFNAGGSVDLEGRIVTLTGGNGVVRRFEFSSDSNVGLGNTRIFYTLSSSSGDLALALATAINSRTAEFGVSAVANGARLTLKGERSVQLSAGLTVIDIAGKTIFVDKSAGPNADGSLAHPFNNISDSNVANAFGSSVSGDIVRIVGNGGSDQKLETTADNFAYEIGYGLLAGTVLSDGATMDVPKGVTVMIDAGAVFKLNRARIGVGSSTLGVDRSGGALQVLGAPILLDSAGNARKLSDGTTASGSVFFTSWLDETIGLDNYQPKTTPSAGNWGGLVFKRDLDRSAGRFDLEDEGIFRQYVNHADIRYGGSSAVVVDSVQQTVNSIQIADMRPTLSFNRVTFGSDAAISATPDSFEETLFSEPKYQRKGSFTPDYNRVGPEIHDNILVNNSINGMFIRVSTPAGGELKQLTVPGRFDDTDVVHVLSENVLIQGNPGGGLLDSSVLPSNLVSLRGRTGGTLTPGLYNYKFTYVDKNGYETPPSNATQNVTVAPGQTAVSMTGLPSVSGEFVNRRLYRSFGTGTGPYRLVAELDGSSTSYEDLGAVLTDVLDDKATLLRDRPDVSGVQLQLSAGGTLTVGGSYNYKIVMVDEAGRESLASVSTSSIVTNVPNRSINLTLLPGLQVGYSARRVYRSSSTGGGTYQLVAQISDATITTFLDNGTNLQGTLSVGTIGNVRPRLDASLAIDPGTIIKLEGARIELGHSTQLLAEGVDGNRVVFTSKQDDRFGIGGTFDTNNNGLNADKDAKPRDWSGIYASPGSKLQLDYAEFAYAGGSSRIEGTFKSFSPIELQQADARIAHSLFENNANGMGGQGPIDRLGRPANENYPLGNNASRGSTLFIRGTQPVILDNVFQNNAGTAMTIDANSMDAVLRGDTGRQSGAIDRNLTLDTNRGPLIRENRLFNNGINGLEIRGDYATNNRDETVLAVRDLQHNILTTESVWDDTDIVHVLFDSITVSNLEHSGGLRLQSAINESLVVKLEGQGSNFDKERGTGFTATGTFNGVSDRVGGTVQIVGQPGFPVVLTSLRDDSVGAGTQPDGRPQTDTNNDGIASVPRAGDWRSTLFDTFSNDRNVATIQEIERVDTVAPGTNDYAVSAQFLGTLAKSEQATDENLPLGFVVHGVLSDANDQDVYSFVGTAGTQVWFDVDNTRFSLDSIIEVLNANGDLLVRSDDSTLEQTGAESIFTTPIVNANNVNPLLRKATSVSRTNASGLLKDDYTTNPRDAGVRLLLPGITGAQSTFFFRIRSKSTNIENSGAGLTSGSYDVQIRLREAQEFPGSTVQFANIRYATNGVHTTGLPYHSQLTGEASTGMYDGTPTDGITQVGSLDVTDRGAISVAGSVVAGGGNLIQFSLGDNDLIHPAASTLYPIAVDVDYADGLNRPDTTAYLFTSQGVFVGADSNIADDRSGPLRGSDLSDLSRGSVGTKDPFVGTVSLPRGTYTLGIGGPNAAPVAIGRNTVLFDDSNEVLPYNGIKSPIQSSFINRTQASNSYRTDNTYWWRTLQTSEGGHGGTAVFGWNPSDPNKVGSTSWPGVLSSNSFTIPTTWSPTDPIRFSMNYQYTSVFGTDLVAMDVVSNKPSAGTLVRRTFLNGNGTDWTNLVVDMSNILTDTTATYTINFTYVNSTGAVITAPLNPILMDDFYLGIWTPRYSPNAAYKQIADESFDSVSASSDMPVLFDQSVVGTGANLWTYRNVTPSVNHSGSKVLAFQRPSAPSNVDGAAAFGEIVSNPIDLSSETGIGLNFAYDFNPHDNNERLDVFYRIAGRADVLVASSAPGTASVTLARTQGQWEQARIDLQQFEGDVGRLVFRYNSQGANPFGSGDTGYAYIDDIKVGLRSRGQLVTNTNKITDFITTGIGGTAGDYQVEIRKSDPIPTTAFGTVIPQPRYTRGSDSTSFSFAAGLVIPDKSIIEISDGSNRIKFQFTYDGTFDFGNSPIVISGTMANWQLAAAVRDAINTMFQQSRLNITAANSSGISSGSAGKSSFINLIGNVEILSGGNLFGTNGVLKFNGFGDKNVARDQGQFVVSSSTITDSRDYAVWSAPADLYYEDGRLAQPLYADNSFTPNYVIPPTLGGSYARKLPILNTVPFAVAAGSAAERAGVAPGMVVVNNVFDSSGLGGLHVQGETPFWRITAIPGIADSGSTNTCGDHSGSFTGDGASLSIDYDRQKVGFEFEEISGASGTCGGTGVVGGNGWNANSVPIYYRSDTGSTYLRIPNTAPGYAADEMVKAIRDSIMGSVLVTNGTTQNIRSWVEPQALPTFDPLNPTSILTTSASIVVQGPQNISSGGPAGVSIQRIGEYQAAPFLRAVNNTIIGKDGRASFNAQQIDSPTNNTIAGATETWQGTGTNTAAYVVDGTLAPDPLSTGSSDVDLYKFHLEVGERVLIDIDTAPTSTLDSALKIFDSNGRGQQVSIGIDPTTMDSNAAPGENAAGRDPYIDFTAKVAGVYYAAVSASGNTSYDPLSLADRRRGATSGAYNLSIKVLKPESYVITVDDPSSYADGETFTIDQVADFAGTTSRSKTFEFTRSGNVTAGNVPIYIGPEYRYPDMARAIAGAINAAGMLNQQTLDNGAFGQANPLAPVSAVALGGINGHSPTIDVPAVNNGDLGINSGNIRGAETEAGLNRYRGPGDSGWTNDRSPFDAVYVVNGVTFRGHPQRGIGHDRTMSLPFTGTNGAPVTSLGNGTTEKYVIVRNASSITSRGNIKVDKDLGANNNLNQIIPESGILVSGGASPTLLNNLFINVQTPIVREFTAGNSSVRPSAVVVGGNTYQFAESRQAFAYLGQAVETSPTNVANTALDFNFTAGNSEQLLVDAVGGNYLPAPGSQVIDSSIDSLPEREGLRAVRLAVGISASPVLAPDRDNSGQLRADDPTVAPPSGLGGNPFKDRGAIDRADFVGPTAVSLNPVDNDAQGVDIDTTASVMRLASGVYPEFRIQLKDGFETGNLQAGTGIDDNSVIGRDGSNRLPGSVVTITENGRLLVEGIDYVFSYNTTTNEIVLTPLAGIWKNDRVYDITLNNKDRFVVDASSGDQTADGQSFTVQDSSGGNVTFEFDSGYRLQIPQGIELNVPLAGGGAGGINDGDRFVIENGTQSFTFEFDNNSNSIAGTTRIPFTSLSTRQDIANAIVTALSTVPNVAPRILGNGNVFVGAVLGAYADTTDSAALTQPKTTTALLVPALGTRPGGVTDGQTFGVSDGRQNLIFEFDSDRSVQQGNIRIDISNASTAADVALVIKGVLDTSGLALATQIVDGDKVYLGLPNAGRFDVIGSNLRSVGVSRALVDGQSIAITRTVNGVPTTKVFEFDTEADPGRVSANAVRIAISVSDTQAEIGDKLAKAIAFAGLGLEPQHVGDGNVFVGGTSEHSISVNNARSVGLFGRPGVQSSTTLDIFGTLLLQLPARGGVDIVDDTKFTITNNNRTVTFEFDGNFSGPTSPANVAVRYTPGSTSSDLVSALLPLIANAGLGIVPRDAGGGRIDLGLLPNSAVNVLTSAVTTTRGSVADGDYFVINNGTTSVTFEFENLSIGNGRDPSRTPIRYNNQSTRADIFAAMKAAIESSSLGLTTVIQSNGLRLLDSAKFTTNIDNAASLSLSGVPGGAVPISFVQDQSFTSLQMQDSIIRAINAAFGAGRTTLQAKARGGSTLYVENAISISPDITSYYLRGIADKAGNFLKSNRINNETQFTILMPGTELDFGDAPDPVSTAPGRYPTLLSSDGARHVSNATGLKLGATNGSELDGTPTPRADGDSSDDGVSFQFQALAKPVFNRNVDTSVTITLSQPGIVDGWIDFNADGDWTDPGENVLNGVEFTSTTLTRTFQIRVPATAPIPAAGINSFARFRASTAGNTLPTGLALDGEVEDYLVRIVPGVPPTGVSDTYTMNEDQVGGLVTTDPTGLLTPSFKVDDGVLANDTSGDGRPLLARLITPPQHTASGAFTFNPDGTFNYQPTLNYFGTDTFVYSSYVNLDVNEGELIESLAQTTVTINIRPVNDVPTANNFSQQIDEDTPLSLSEQSIILLSGALAGPANESDQTLRVSLPNFVSAQGGSLNLIGNNLVYTPKLNFSGVDTFTFRLTDNGFTGTLLDPLSVIRTVTVTVRDVNDAPITTPKSFTVVEDVVDASNTYPISFFTNGDTAGPSSETDPPPLGQGQTISFSGVVLQSEKGGTVSFADGKVTYRSAPDFNGTDRFFYLVTDSDPSDPKTSRGTVTVTVTPVNDAPRVVASLGQITMLEDEVERALPLASYFFDPDVIPNDDRLSYVVISNTNPNLVEPTIGPTDIFVRPKPDQNGQAIVVFEASDRANNKVRNTLTVNVTPVNDSPRLAAPLPNLSVQEDSTIADTVLSPTYFYDPDVIANGDVLTFSVTNSNTDVVTATIVNGRLRLVLVTDASGLAIITVKVVDSTGNTIEDSFDLAVAPVNDAPRLVNDTYTTPQGTELRTSDATGTLTTAKNDDGVLANDRDIEGNPFTARIRTAPTRGTVNLNADGTFSYIPASTTLTGAVDTFTYEAVDSLGAVSLPATVTITITNPPPPRHQNPIQKLDVDADGFISPIDVLLIVNFINANGPSTSVANLPSPPPYRDVNGNNIIEPLDVLEVINYINARGNSGAGEGEMVGVMDVMPNLSAPLTWSSDVMRNSPNIATTMVTAANYGRLADAAKPLAADSRPAPASLAEYLASFGAEDEELDRLVSATAESPASTDHESLDSFFAEVFGS